MDYHQNKETLTYFTSLLLVSSYHLHRFIISSIVPVHQVSCKGHNWTIICCQSYCTAEDNSDGTILMLTNDNSL